MTPPTCKTARTRALAAVVSLAMLLAPTQALAREASVELATGEVLTGSFVSQNDDQIIIEHPVLGEITIPRDQIVAAVIEPPAEPAADGPTAAGEAEGTVVPEPTEWDFSAGAGLTGSRGSSDTDNLRLNFNALRQTERIETTFDLTFNQARSDGENTANRFETRGRNVWLVPESKWRYFAQGSWEVDQFQDYDQRFRGGGGLGYQFIDNDKHSLLGRLGLGVIHEEGGDRSGETGLEAILGVDYRWTIDDRSEVTFTAELFPDISEGGKLRSRSIAAYEFYLTDEGDLSLQIGLEHRFDKFQDSDKNDFDYFALILYAF